MQAVAWIKQIPETEVAKATTENALRVFGLSGSRLECRLEGM
jgi:Tat protein secretion system quality control protein TatD with DNase activity